MAETKFTPGPWMVDAGETYNVRDSATEGIVAQIHFLRGRMGLAGRITTEQGLANAHLVAAAPEMFMTLREMVSDDAFAELCAGIGEEPTWLIKARAILSMLEIAVIAPTGDGR